MFLSPFETISSVFGTGSGLFDTGSRALDGHGLGFGSSQYSVCHVMHGLRVLIA